MFTTLLRIAALVVFVFALIASLTTGATCLSETLSTWIACGLLAWAAAIVIGPWLDAQYVATRTPRPPVS